MPRKPHTAEYYREYRKKNGDKIRADYREKYYKNINPLRVVFRGMKARCECVTCKSYPSYGGRGIKVSESWKKFENFRKDMELDYLKHIYDFGKSNTQLDRINNNAGYSKSNCKWSTRKEQCNNTRRNKKNA